MTRRLYVQCPYGSDVGIQYSGAPINEAGELPDDVVSWSLLFAHMVSRPFAPNTTDWSVIREWLHGLLREGAEFMEESDG